MEILRVNRDLFPPERQQPTVPTWNIDYGNFSRRTKKFGLNMTDRQVRVQIESIQFQWACAEAKQLWGVKKLTPQQLREVSNLHNSMYAKFACKGTSHSKCIADLLAMNRKLFRERFAIDFGLQQE